MLLNYPIDESIIKDFNLPYKFELIDNFEKTEYPYEFQFLQFKILLLFH